MLLQGGTQINTPKIFIRTMQDDLQSLTTRKAVFETNVQIKPKASSKAPPPKELPVASLKQPAKYIEPPVRIVEKIVEKPVIKEIRVPVEKIVEKIVKVPVEKIVEKIVKVPVEKIVEKSVSTDKSRQLKQTIIILILVIILTAFGFGGYYLLKMPGQQIVVKPQPTPEPLPSEPVPQEPAIPQPGLLPNIPQIVQTKTDKPLNLPPDLTYKDYNLLVFPDKKLGLVLQVSNVLESLAEMVFWEKTMLQDLSWLFLDNAPSKAKFKVNNWEYPNIVIRFQDTIDLSQSLHYTLIQNKLIITTSEESMSLIINALLHES